MDIKEFMFVDCLHVEIFFLLLQMFLIFCTRNWTRRQRIHELVAYIETEEREVKPYIYRQLTHNDSQSNHNTIQTRKVDGDFWSDSVVASTRTTCGKHYL